MVGLVEQIQIDAMNPGIPVSTLLRKVKVAAAKLELDGVLSWVDHELNGYNTDAPEYLRGQGETVGWNRYHGWQPLHVEDSNLADTISLVYLFEPISNYEALLEANERSFYLALPNEVVSLINQHINFPLPKFSNKIARGLIVQVVQRVRDMVLDWALELARAGITGHGLSFSADERERATGAHISIGTFQGNFNAGNAVGSNSRINQDSEDNSTNIVSDHPVFGNVEQVVQASVSNKEEREAILQANSDMRTAKDPKTLLAAYERFITAAANHITVIGPFLPALTGLLTR